MTTTTGAPARAGTVPAWDRPVRLTALHREHLAHGAELVERDGWLLPRSYGHPGAEAAAVREGIGLLDIGASGKFDLQGDGVDAALAAAFSLGTVEVGATIQTGPDGSARVYRLTDGQALVLTSPAGAQATLEALEVAAGEQPCTHVTDLTGALCGLRLLGPRAAALLERLCALDLAPDRFADGALAQSAVARIHAVIARHDAAGVTGYDLYVDRDLGSYLWESLLEQGAPLSVRPVGYEAIRD